MPLPSYNILNSGQENVALVAPAAGERVPVVDRLYQQTIRGLEREFPDLAPGQLALSPAADPARLAVTHYVADQQLRAATAAVDAANAAPAEVIKGVINAA